MFFFHVTILFENVHFSLELGTRTVLDYHQVKYSGLCYIVGKIQLKV